MTKLQVQHRPGGPLLTVEWAHYAATGETAMRLFTPDGEPYCTATVSPHPPTPPAHEGHVWLSTWSERTGLPEALEKAGVVGRCTEVARAGYSVIQLHALTPAALAERALAYANNAAMAKDLAAIRKRQQVQA